MGVLKRVLEGAYGFFGVQAEGFPKPQTLNPKP